MTVKQSDHSRLPLSFLAPRLGISTWAPAARRLCGSPRFRLAAAPIPGGSPRLAPGDNRKRPCRPGRVAPRAGEGQARRPCSWRLPETCLRVGCPGTPNPRPENFPTLQAGFLKEICRWDARRYDCLIVKEFRARLLCLIEKAVVRRWHLLFSVGLMRLNGLGMLLTSSSFPANFHPH